MQMIRTLVWVLLLVALVAFSVANWAERVEVSIWSNLVLETNLPAVVIISFLLGLLPAWLALRANSWRLERKIRNLQGTAPTPVPAATASPAPTATAAPSPSPAARAQEDAGPLTTDDKV